MEVLDMQLHKKRKSQVLVLTLILLLAMSITVAACFSIVARYSNNLKDRMNKLSAEVYKDANS